MREVFHFSDATNPQIPPFFQLPDSQGLLVQVFSERQHLTLAAAFTLQAKVL